MFFLASVSVIHLCVREQTKQIKMFRKYLIPSRLGNLLKSIYNHEEEPAPTGSCFRASVAISPLLNPPPCVFFVFSFEATSHSATLNHLSPVRNEHVNGSALIEAYTTATYSHV